MTDFIKAFQSSEAIYRLGWTLFHTLWLGAAIAVLFIAAMLVLRRRSANGRYLVGCVAMALMIALPVAALFMIPASAEPLLGPADIAGSLSAARLLRVAIDVVPEPAATNVSVQSDIAAEVGKDSAAMLPSKLPFLTRASRSLEPALPWAVLVWAIGVFLLSIWQVASWIATRRLKRLASQPGDNDLIAIVAHLAREMRISRPVKVLESMLVRAPTVIGWLRPVILLPLGLATGLTPEQLQAVLAHELAHIRRYDYLVNLLQLLVETLLFYHPAVWFISRRVRVERENCCDDMAVAAGAERFSYAESLLRVARDSAGRPRRLVGAVALGVHAMGRPSRLRSRIVRLLSGGTAQTTRLSRSWPITMIFLVVVVVTASVLVNVGAQQIPKNDEAASGAEAATRSAAQPPMVNPSGDPNVRLKMWIDDFFSHKYRDITDRKTLEWGPVEKQANGNLSVRYKYLATIQDGRKLVIDALFRFTPEGEFVTVKKLSRTRDAQAEALAISDAAKTSKQMAFIYAIVNGDLERVRRLLADDPTLISVVDDRGGKRGSGLPALLLAVRYGHPEIVELLFSKGAKPNERNLWGGGPLHEAAWMGKANLVELLVKHGVDVNGAKNGFQTPPLHLARDAQVAEALIANGAAVNWRDKRGATLLHSIAGSQFPEVAEVLLAHGADINATDGSGLTPLHVAASDGFERKEMVELLISKGASINAKDSKGLTALEHALTDDWTGAADDWRGPVEKAHIKAIAGLLLSHGADPTTLTIHDVVWLGDIARVRKLLEDNPSLANDVGGPRREPVLCTAVREGHIAIAELLLENGAKLNVVGRWKEPPLHAASHAGHKDMVALLLRKGADVNRKGAHGELALHWAVAKGHDEITQLLIEAGAEVITRADKQGVDMDAAAEEDVDVVHWWLKHLAVEEKRREAKAVGSDLQTLVPLRLAFAAGDTPLHSAAQWGRTEIVEMLLANGADVTARNRWGQTPLHYASAFDETGIAKALLRAGSKVNVRSQNGRTPLGIAAAGGHEELVKFLLNHGASTQPADQPPEPPK